MDPRLLDHYNRELAHLREMGAEFAREFPKIAARLGMEGIEVADPYVERLLEGFAFIAARVQFEIASEFPRFTQHLLEIIYPHYLAPTPSMMNVEILPDFSDPGLAVGVTLPVGSVLRGAMLRGEQTACEFRTAHPLTLWPIQILSARCFSFAPDLPLGRLGLSAQVRGGLRLRLAARTGGGFGSLACDRLSLHLCGNDEIVGPLLEALAGRCIGALLVSTDSPPKVIARIDPQSVQADGFDDAQALLPYRRRAFQAFRLLREYFSFPARFHFIRIDALRRGFAALGGATECELVLLFDRIDPALEGSVDAGNFSLHTTPAVNLFPKRADRIHLSDSVHEHQVIIDRTRPMDFEVFSITSVTGLGEETRDQTEFLPFYGDLVHHDASSARAFYTMRRASRMLSEHQRRHGPRTGYIGTEVFLSLVDEREAPYPRTMRQLAVEVLASNRDLPLLMPAGAGSGLSLDTSAPVSGIRIVSGPTRPRKGVADGDHAWRLVSQLSLNYLSLFDGGRSGAAAEALREQLLLYVDAADQSLRKQIEAVTGLTARPVVRRLPVPGPITFGRGLEVALTIEETAFGGAGGFLLGAVLERFFARQVSINAFTQTLLSARSRGEIMRWPARSGTRTIG